MANHEDPPLLFDKLASGDRPSILALGVSGAESLKRARIAVFMVDALGQVQLLAPTSVKVIAPARVKDEDLDALEEGTAIDVLLAQGDTDEDVIEYLRRRNGRGGERGQSNL